MGGVIPSGWVQDQAPMTVTLSFGFVFHCFYYFTLFIWLFHPTETGVTHILTYLHRMLHEKLLCACTWLLQHRLAFRCHTIMTTRRPHILSLIRRYQQCELLLNRAITKMNNIRPNLTECQENTSDHLHAALRSHKTKISLIRPDEQPSFATEVNFLRCCGNGWMWKENTRRVYTIWSS